MLLRATIEVSACRFQQVLRKPLFFRFIAIAKPHFFVIIRGSSTVIGFMALPSAQAFSATHCSASQLSAFFELVLHGVALSESQQSEFQALVAESFASTADFINQQERLHHNGVQQAHLLSTSKPYDVIILNPERLAQESASTFHPLFYCFCAFIRQPVLGQSVLADLIFDHPQFPSLLWHQFWILDCFRPSLSTSWLSICLQNPKGRSYVLHNLHLLSLDVTQFLNPQAIEQRSLPTFSLLSQLNSSFTVADHLFDAINLFYISVAMHLQGQPLQVEPLYSCNTNQEPMHGQWSLALNTALGALHALSSKLSPQYNSPFILPLSHIAPKSLYFTAFIPQEDRLLIVEHLPFGLRALEKQVKSQGSFTVEHKSTCFVQQFVQTQTAPWLSGGTITPAYQFPTQLACAPTVYAHRCFEQYESLAFDLAHLKRPVEFFTFAQEQHVQGLSSLLDAFFNPNEPQFDDTVFFQHFIALLSLKPALTIVEAFWQWIDPSTLLNRTEVVMENGQSYWLPKWAALLLYWFSFSQYSLSTLAGNRFACLLHACDFEAIVLQQYHNKPNTFELDRQAFAQALANTANPYPINHPVYTQIQHMAPLQIGLLLALPVDTENTLSPLALALMTFNCTVLTRTFCPSDFSLPDNLSTIDPNPEFGLTQQQRTIAQQIESHNQHWWLSIIHGATQSGSSTVARKRL